MTDTVWAQTFDSNGDSTGPKFNFAQASPTAALKDGNFVVVGTKYVWGSGNISDVTAHIVSASGVFIAVP